MMNKLMKYGVPGVLAGMFWLSAAATEFDTISQMGVWGNADVRPGVSRITESNRSLGVFKFQIRWQGLPIPGGFNEQSCEIQLVQGMVTQSISGSGNCEINPGFCGPLNYAVSASVSASGSTAVLSVVNKSGEKSCSGSGWSFSLPSNSQRSFSFDISSGDVRSIAGGYDVKVNGVPYKNTSFSASFLSSGRLAYPVVFVHGLLSDSSTWRTMYNSLSRENAHGLGKSPLKFGGHLYAEDVYRILAPQGRSGVFKPTVITSQYGLKIKVGKSEDLAAGDFYFVNFSDASGLSFYAQAVQLKAFVEYVLAETGKNKVILVGHSMGGLASRAYVQFFDKSKVKGLITLGTPHAGAYRGVFESLLGASDYMAGAFRALDPLSSDLAFMNFTGAGNSTADPKASVASALSGINLLSLHFMQYGGANYGQADGAGDGIVPIDSQKFYGVTNVAGNGWSTRVDCALMQSDSAPILNDPALDGEEIRCKGFSNIAHVNETHHAEARKKVLSTIWEWQQ